MRSTVALMSTYCVCCLVAGTSCQRSTEPFVVAVPGPGGDSMRGPPPSAGTHTASDPGSAGPAAHGEVSFGLADRETAVALRYLSVMVHDAVAANEEAHLQALAKGVELSSWPDGHAVPFSVQFIRRPETGTRENPLPMIRLVPSRDLAPGWHFLGLKALPGGTRLSWGMLSTELPDGRVGVRFRVDSHPILYAIQTCARGDSASLTVQFSEPVTISGGELGAVRRGVGAERECMPVGQSPGRTSFRVSLACPAERDLVETRIRWSADTTIASASGLALRDVDGLAAPREYAFRPVDTTPAEPGCEIHWPWRSARAAGAPGMP